MRRMSRTSRARVADVFGAVQACSFCAMLAERDALDQKRDGEAQFAKSLDGGLYQVDAGRAQRTEIHLDSLPRASPVLKRDFDAHCIGKLHLTNGGFDPERKLVEAQLQRLLELPEPGGAVPRQTHVEVFGGAGALCETQFHGNPTLQIVAAEQTIRCGLFEHPTERQKGNPSSEAFLIETLVASNARQRLLQPFRPMRPFRIQWFGHNERCDA